MQTVRRKTLRFISVVRVGWVQSLATDGTAAGGSVVAGERQAVVNERP